MSESISNRNTIRTGSKPPINSLLVRVPEEVWTHIFTFVGNDDLANLTLTCGTFSKYLQKRKPTFLFQQLIPIIRDYYDYPSFMSNLINYRLICKSWKVGVDTYLENLPRPSSEQDVKSIGRNRYNPRNHGWSCAFGKALSVSTMRTFQEVMGPRSSMNPFPGRSVHLYIGPNDDRDNLYYEITDVFMKQFGVHLWHVYITDSSFDDDDEFVQNRCTPPTLYIRLRKLLTSMPNLRSFMYSIDEFDAGVVEHSEKSLAAFTLKFPLPVMPHLEQLDASIAYNEDPAYDSNEANVTRFCQLIQDLLMSTYSLQLKVLHIHWKLWKPEYCAREALRNLRDLHLEDIESNQNLETLATKCGAGDGLMSLPELFALQMDFDFADVNTETLLSFIKTVLRGCPKLRIIVLKVNYDTDKVVTEFFTLIRSNDDLTLLKGLECSIKEWHEELPQRLLL